MHLNSKFIDLCRNRSVFRLVPFDQNEFENHTYKKPLDYFNFFWKKYEKFKKEYKKLKKKEINNSYNGSAMEIILTFLFTREKIKIEKMDEEIDIKYVKPDFILRGNKKKFFISSKVSIRERWKQADWEAIKYKKKYNNDLCILLMNNKSEYKSILEKISFLSLDKVYLANSNDLNKMIKLIKF